MGNSRVSRSTVYVSKNRRNLESGKVWKFDQRKREYRGGTSLNGSGRERGGTTPYVEEYSG
jgi:hypothetical protein